MIECEFLQNSRCTLAEKLAARYNVRRIIRVKEDACNACLNCDCPKTTNYVTISHVFHAIKGFNQSKFMQFELECSDALRGKNKCVEIEEDVDLGIGPGTNLHFILKREGFKISFGCTCLQVIREMNFNSPEWCLFNIDYIADSMLKEAHRRKIKLPDELLIYQAKEWIKEACQINQEK